MGEQDADGRSQQATELAERSPPTAAEEPAGDAEPATSAQPSAAGTDAEFVAALRLDARGRAPATFRYTRWMFMRSLGFIYVVAFAILHNQALALIEQSCKPLLGELHLLPG